MVELEVTQAYEGGFRVSWRLSGTEHMGDTQVEVLRSASFTGPWITVLPATPDVTDFVDGLLPPEDQPFYRIRIYRRGYDPVEFPSIGGRTVAPEQDSLVRHVAHEIVWSVRQAGGRKILYYPVKTSGPHCHCFDTVSGKTANKNCRSCFGTGFQGGFFNPLVVHMAIGPARDRDSKTPNVGIAGYIPLARRGDVVIEREGRRWEVDSATLGEYRRNPVRHTLHLQSVGPSSILRELPVDYALLGSDISQVGDLLT
jgi:hypothetical protein